MGMIDCRDCASPISSNAKACPRCGAPTHAGGRHVSGEAIGFLMIVPGMLMAIAGATTWGWILMVVGFFVFVAGRMR